MILERKTIELGMAEYLVDTNIWIHILKANADLGEYIEGLDYAIDTTI